MAALDATLEQYITGIDKTVADNLTSLTDINIDHYSDEGNNGYIFFGNHRIFRSRVAVKYYYYADESHEEVTLIKTLKHKNILNVWDAHIVANGWAYFITDEMTNGTLDAYMDSNNISTYRAMDIVRGLLAGVGKMHESPNFLLHRDLKPANILMDSTGNPVIADFGSIKRLPHVATSVKASQHSLLYRPPESFEEGKYMVVSDIYQLGLIMYQVLGGFLPYDGCEYMTRSQYKEYLNLRDSYEQSKYIDSVLQNKIIKGKLINIASLPFYCHPKLISIIRKATSPKPDRRYQNVSDFFLAMHRIGNIPDWVRDNNGILAGVHNSNYYRIIHNGKGFILEKSKNGVAWRKATGTKYETSEDATYKQAF